MTEQEETKVIFRTFKDDNRVIALFPEELGTNDLSTCLSYMHVGQHGNASVFLVDDTRPSTESELKPLYDELTNHVGYNLKIVKRFTRNMYHVRKNKLDLIYSV